MPKYIIEREIPGAGQMSAAQIKGAATQSNAVLAKMGPQIQWLESYVTSDRLYCVYISPNEDMIRAHASKGGFPVNRIAEVKGTLDPTSAEG